MLTAVGFPLDAVSLEYQDGTGNEIQDKNYLRELAAGMVTAGYWRAADAPEPLH